MNLIPVKDQIRHETCCHFLDRFSSLGVGAYGIRPTNASAWRRMTDKPGTCWGVCFCALPIPIKNLIPIYWMNLKPGGFWGVCLCAPTHTDQKFDSHLLDKSQTRRVLGCMSLRPTPPRRESLKICIDARKTRRGLDENGHIHRKPGGDWTNMAISIENPAGIGRKWPYSPKTRRGLDENGHIHRKPGGDWTNMVISIENPARIG